MWGLTAGLQGWAAMDMVTRSRGWPACSGRSQTPPYSDAVVIRYHSNCQGRNCVTLNDFQPLTIKHLVLSEIVLS